MNPVVIDTETTGTGDTDQVVELAAVWGPGKHDHIHFLVQPTVPVDPVARAAHHITDRTLATARQAPAWLETVREVTGRDGAVLVFHNAEFDTRLIRQTWPEIGGTPVICTWRASLHLWPDAPSHRNQVLRYWLDLQVPALTLHPHRALPDAIVTWVLLHRMLEERSLEDLLRMTTEPVVLHRVRFGKHVGKLWEEVPRDYLQWILRQRDFDPDTLHTARTLLGVPPPAQLNGEDLPMLFTYQPEAGPTPQDGADYTAHSGQVVKIVRHLPDSMFEVRADDGWTGNVFQHELRKQ